MINPKTKLIVILGPTASGKTDLALDLALLFGGEIICADSRTIYRGMDIGTAKPTRQEQAQVRHHLLDLVDPGESLSVAAFKALAEETIADIAARKQIPFLVGGSGLYIDSILFDYQFPAEADPARRAELESMADQDLRQLLAAEDPEAFARIDVANRRRVIRAIETMGQSPSRQTRARPQTLVLGLALNKEVIQQRVTDRTEKMLGEGLLEEVARIGSTYGWDSEALSGVAYRAFKDVVLGTKTLEAGTADCIRGDLQLIKKQLTWFKRNPAIQWLDDPAAAELLVRSFLRG